MKWAPAASSKSQILSLSLVQREDFFAPPLYNPNPLTKSSRWLAIGSIGTSMHCSLRRQILHLTEFSLQKHPRWRKGSKLNNELQTNFFSEHRAVSLCFPFIELLLESVIVLRIISFNSHKKPMESRPSSPFYIWRDWRSKSLSSLPQVMMSDRSGKETQILLTQVCI